MRNLDLVYKTIQTNNPDYEEKLKNGDIFVVHGSLFNEKLTPNETLYIAAYYSHHKNIKKADEYIKNIVSNQTLITIKNKLVKLGYIKIEEKTPEELKNETIKLSHKGAKCEWCKKPCYIIEEHHFPISAKDGGDKVVRICPNCHYTFHKLEKEKYK